MSDCETLERQTAKPERQQEDTFEVNGEYIAGQAREAMRIFFLPMTSVVRAARSHNRRARRDARRRRAA